MHSLLPPVMIIALLLSAPAYAGKQQTPEPEVDCDNAGSTYEMNVCAGREFEAADKELNDVYKRALAAVPDMATERPYDATSWADALRKSQRAWLAYRDAECEGHVPMFWSGGSGATADMTGCATDLTKARTKELKERYEVP